MANYERILTLPGALDFTIHHLKSSYKCNSLLLKAVSPVIKNLDSNSYTLPPIKGNVRDVFNVIFSTECSNIPAESTNLLIATLLQLDIKHIYEPILNYLSNELEKYDDFYNLVKELSISRVPIDNLVPIFAKHLDNFLPFIYKENKTTMDVNFVKFFAKLFTYRQIKTNEPIRVMKHIIEFYKYYPTEFNDSITNFTKLYLSEEIIGMLIQIDSYDLNQIKDELKHIISNISNPFNGLFHSCSTYASEVPESSTQLPGIFYYLKDGNLIQNHLQIISSVDFEVGHDPYKIVDQNYETFYSSIPSLHVSLTFRLLSSAINPAGYSITVPDTDIIPCSWQLDASVDGQDWKEISKVSDDSELASNSKKIVKTKETSELYSYFRLAQTKIKECEKEPRFILSQFELYGKYYELELV